MDRQDSLERAHSQTLDRLRVLSARYLKPTESTISEQPANNTSSVPENARMDGVKTMQDAPWLIKVALDDEGAWGTYACSQLHVLASISQENSMDLVSKFHVVKTLAGVLARDAKRSASSRSFFAATTTHALGAVAQFTQLKQNRAQMVQDGAIDGIVAMISRCLDLEEEGVVSSSGQNTSSLQNTAAGILYNLAVEDENRVAIANTKNFLRCLSECMLGQPQKSLARDYSCRTLWALSASDELQPVITQQKVVTQACFTIAMTDSHSRDSCLSTIRNLTAKSASAEALVTQFPTLPTVSQLIVSLCTAQTDDAAELKAHEKSVTTACTILYQLSGAKECHNKFKDDLSSVVKGVCAALECSFVTDAHQKAIGVLYQLSAANDELKLGLLSETNEVSVLPTLTHCLDRPNTLQLASATFYFLSAHPECRRLLCAPQSRDDASEDQQQQEPKELFSTMAESLKHAPPKVALYLCATITNFATDGHDMAVRLVKVEGLLHAIVGVIERALGLKPEEEPVPGWNAKTNDTEQAVERACGALYAISKERKTRDVLAATDGLLSAVLNAIEKGSEKTKEYSCAVLWCLAESGGGEARNLLGGVDALLRVIDTQGPGKTREAALTVIQNLSLNTSIQGDLVPLVVPTLIKVLTTDTGKSQDLASGTLNSLCSHEPTMRDMVIRYNLPQGAAIVLDSQTASDMTKMNIIAGLCVLLLEKHNLTDLVTKHNFVHYIVVSLKTVMHQDFKVTMCSALQHIAHEDSLKERLYKEPEVMETLLRILGEAEPSVARDDCCRAVCFLASSEENREVMIKNPGLLPALLKLLSDPAGQAQVYAIGALWGLAVCSDNRTILADEPGLVDALTGLVMNAKSDDKYVKYACLTLKNLAMEAENRMLLLDFGIVQAMRHVLVTMKKSVVVENACSTLRHLAASEETHSALEEADIINPLQQVMASSKGKASELAGTVLLLLKKVDVVAKATAEREKNKPTPVVPAQPSAPGQPPATPAPAPQPKPKSEEDELVAKEDFKHSTRVMQEFVDSERVYVNALRIVLEDYQVPLMKLKNAKSLRVAELFQDLPSIFATHSRLYERMTAALKEERPKWPSLFAAALIELSPFLKQCSPFIDKFDIVMDNLDKLFKDKKVAKVLQDVKTPLDLRSYLIMPVQRVPRLVLLLKDLINHTEEEDPAYAQLEEAMASLQEVATHCNERKREADSRYKQSAIALSVRGLPDELNLMESNRKFIYEGRIMIPANERRLYPVNFMVFSDLIMWTQERVARGDQQTYKGHIMLLPKKAKMTELTADDVTKLRFHVPKVLVDKGFGLELGVFVVGDKAKEHMFPLSSLAKTHFMTHMKQVPALAPEGKK